MPLSFGPARLSSQPKDADHVSVYSADGQEATLTDPVSIDDAGLVSFTVSQSGWYKIVSRTGYGASSSTTVELADDGIGVPNPSDIRQRVDAALAKGGGGGGGPVSWSAIQNKPTEFTPTEHQHSISDIEAEGDPDESTFLRGDGTWSAPAGGGGAVDSVNGKTGEVVLNPPDLNFPTGASILGLLMSPTVEASQGWLTSRIKNLPGTEVQLGGFNLPDLLSERVHIQNYESFRTATNNTFSFIRDDLDALEDAVEDIPAPVEDMNEWGYVPTVVIPNGGELPTPLPAFGVVYELEEN